jgi:hypothetical protein
MKNTLFPLLSLVLAISSSSAPSTYAGTVDVFRDDFESYASGESPLDKNLAGGPNAAPNGSGNPWWGIAALPNIYVVGSEEGPTPHSGTNMIRGLSGGGDFDQAYYNLAYRLSGEQVLNGNFSVEWWFYDPVGGYSTNGFNNSYRDYVAIDYYTGIPGNADYAGPDSAPTLGTVLQRISLGAAPNSSAGVNYDYYQGRIVGSPLGYANGNFNTTTLRSAGWHQARIAFGPPTNNNPLVYFYIDDMATPTVAPAICPTTQGFNAIELNAAFGATDGYFDDFRVALDIPPNLVAARSGKNLNFTWPAGFTLQSATVVTGPYTDLSSAYTGYAYDVTTGPQRFFRLRN